MPPCAGRLRARLCAQGSSGAALGRDAAACPQELGWGLRSRVHCEAPGAAAGPGQRLVRTAETEPPPARNAPTARSSGRGIRRWPGPEDCLGSEDSGRSWMESSWGGCTRATLPSRSRVAAPPRLGECCAATIVQPSNADETVGTDVAGLIVQDTFPLICMRNADSQLEPSYRGLLVTGRENRRTRPRDNKSFRKSRWVCGSCEVRNTALYGARIIRTLNI